MTRLVSEIFLFSCPPHPLGLNFHYEKFVDPNQNKKKSSSLLYEPTQKPPLILVNLRGAGTVNVHTKGKMILLFVALRFAALENFAPGRMVSGFS